MNLTQQTNDKRQLEPMAQEIVRNVERLAETTSADAGYFSEQAVKAVTAMGTNLHVPPARQKHSATETAAPLEEDATASTHMRAKMQTVEARVLYRMRKAIVEPVFGQIKAARGIRRFLLRGFSNARHEFSFMALTHNLLKLFRAGATLAA